MLYYLHGGNDIEFFIGVLLFLEVLFKTDVIILKGF
jgi:hypothetical protein